MPSQVHDLPSLPPRARDSHKGDHGRVLLVAGSPGMCGAAVLAARAALRCGSGLVTVAIPAALSHGVTAAVPEAMHIHLTADDDLPEDLDGRFDALGIGPGLGTSDRSRRLLERALGSWSGPQVIDADALNLVAAGVPTSVHAERVWTPHPGELERLTGQTPREKNERVTACECFVAQRGGVIVLKGHRTVIHDGERYTVNRTGNPGMATGGSGDVLTGVITSLLGQGLGAFDAARLGAHLHGAAGDAAAARVGEASLIASDLVDCLPDAFASLCHS